MGTVVRSNVPNISPPGLWGRVGTHRRCVMKPNTKHLFVLIGMVTLLLSIPAVVKSQDGTWDASRAGQLDSEMQNAYNTFLQLVDQGQADTPAGQQAFAAYDSARIRFCDYVATAPMIADIDEASEEARKAWEEYKRLRAQGKTDEVGEPRNASISGLMGDVDPLENTYGAFCLTTPPPGYYEQGVEITIRVEAEGYEPTGTTLHTQDYEPSSIQIYGLVTDKDGKPIPGATVTLAAPSKTETTDASGSYQLYVETVGTKPYADKLDWVLETKVSAVNIDFKPPEIIPIPGEVPLSITVTDQDGLPLKKATAIITLVDGHKMPFLTIENDQAWLDEKGQFSTKLTTRDPAGMDYVYLTDIPLEATISVEIKDREESNTLGQIEVKRPFNLALIHGVTVGPDMEPRAEEFAPELVPDRPDMSKLVDIAKELLFDQEKNDRGDFWILVRPYYPRTMQPPPKGVWHLKWSMFDHLPLHYPLPNPPVPGKVLELGKIDVLTPEEHEARLTQIVGEFLIAMPLKPGARQGVWDNLYALTFAVDASKDVPFYRDNALDWSGTIYYPDKPENYWGQNPQKGNDPAYVIISHELGHFLHHALIERHGYRHFCYKFGVGLGHNTWQPPDLTIKNVDLAPMTAKEYTSFSESNADFFASLLIPFWLKHHPEMAESIYLQDLGYLAEFDTDEKAMDVVSAGIPGFIVEGVQTRFLRAIYARYLADRPEWAYADYLATMWLYMEKPEHWTPSFLTRPARTISQWAQTKARLGSPISLTTTFAFAAGNSTLVLAEKYKVLKPPEPSPVTTYPVVLPLDTAVRPVVRIGSQTVDFANWDLPAAKANVGEEIEVEHGAVALAPSGDRDGGTVVLKEKAKVILRDLATVEVQRGVVAIEGPVKAQTRNATVKPSGTVYVVEVTDSGETVVSTFDGEVVAESNMGSSRTLGTGEQVEITAQGAMGETTTFDVSAATKDLLSAPEMPFDLQALSEYEETLGPGETVLDTQEPTISNLRPADGAIVRIDPTISADYADNPGGSGIDTDAVTIMVDGVDRTAEATVTGSNISFEPGKLAKGPHEVTVVIIDRDGNSASVSWWFEVQRGTGILPYGLGIAAALLMGIGALGVLFSRGGLEPALAPLASQAIAIRQQVRAGGLHPSQVRALTGQDRQGRRWSLDPLQERWQLWTGAAWRPARPPLARRWGCIVGGLSALGLGGLLGLLVVGLLISEGLPQTPSIARATAIALRQYVPTATSMSAPPPSVITPTPQAGLLPDLVIARARITMRGYTGGCVTEFAPLVTEVCVENRGAAAAGPFVIQAGDGAQWPVEGLTAGEQRCLKSESDVSGQMVTVDAGETVAESDETNNTLIVPIPTPPAICTPLPTLTPEATSLPTEAEFVRILAVEAPDQVSAGELFVVTIRYAWSFRDEGTVGIRAEGGGGYRGQPGLPTEVTGEGEFTHSLPVLAPDTPAPHTFMVEAYGYSATSPDLTDQREMMVSVIAPGGQAELDAETALTILPSAAELGVDRLEFADFIMPDEGAGFGALPVFRSSSQDTVVDLMVFASADDAGRFTNQTFSDYQSMGSPPTWTDLGDESFARQDEVLVRVDRYILWALSGMSPDQLRPSVQRLQTFAGGGP
jgi:hypothetical protein